MRTLSGLLLVVLLGGCVAGPVADRRESSSSMTTDSRAVRVEPQLAADSLVTADGASLPLRQWLPAEQPTAVILALHGFNDYSNAFAVPGAAWAQNGIATYAFDQRGFGGAPDRGRWAGAERLAADAASAAALLRRRHPGVPLYLLGESMGGAVAILAASGHGGASASDLDGVILVAPAVWGRQTMNVVERVGLWLTDLIPAMTLSLDHLPVSFQPSDNIPMLRAFSADPLVLKTTRADTVNGLVDLMTAALATGRRFDAPLFVLYGAHDEIVPRESLARFVEELPARAAHRQRIALYPQGYHMLLRDLEGQVPIADVAAWVRDTAAPLPSGADDARAQLTGHAAPATVARDEGLRVRARG